MARFGGFCVGTLVMISALAYSGGASAATDCLFSTRGRVMTLQNDCSTDATILVPDGFTLNGRDHTVTAVDPPGGHFLGAVFRNAGAEANVRDVHITTAALAEVCDAGENALRGIALVDASGAVTGNVITNLNQANGTSGCQEGNAIDVRNSSATGTRVRIDGNVLEAYQKTGIVVLGNVNATVRANRVAGFGPVPTIAQNGIQVSAGARATVDFNIVSGNSYTGTAGGVVATGILVTGDPTAFTIRTRITHNVLLENDVGIVLSNVADAQSHPPATPTDIEVIENALFKSSLTNGSGVQIGISDVGNHDRIIGNTIAGPGYDPAVNPSTLRIFAEPPFAIDPVLRRNRFLP